MTEPASAPHVHSMTGFGQADAESARFRVRVALRGVNHRYLDVVVRLRDEYRQLEADVRAHLAARLTRGRVEATIELEPRAARGLRIEIDETMGQAVDTLQGDLEKRGWLRGGALTFADLLRLPAITVRQDEVAWGAEDDALLREALDGALDQLLAARAAEGAELAAAIVARLDGLEALHAEMTARVASLPARLTEAHRRRLDELLAGTDATLDPQRLAQEIALLADRSDVSEELDRLRTHLGHARTLLDRAEAVGKRLDFLAQEIFRECNTIGAKCRDAEVVRLVLDAKALCEQIREQVQNVE
ncbi:MAG: YicC/YloC family endoribonuclease [Acidobacteriota bacterium]